MKKLATGTIKVYAELSLTEFEQLTGKQSADVADGTDIDILWADEDDRGNTIS